MKINAHEQFHPTQQNLNDILSEYGYELLSFEVPTSGIENVTAIVNCKEGKYVLRIYRQGKKTDEHVIQEWDFVNFLHQQGFETSSVMRNKAGQIITKHSDNGLVWQVILMEFMNGSHPTSYSTILINNMAVTQAKMHLLGRSHGDSFYGAPLRNLRETHFIKDIDMSKLAIPELVGFLKRAKEYQVHLNEELAWGLCHLDFDSDNILVNAQDELTGIIDFDDLALAPYVVDLAYTLWIIYYSNGESAVETYLKTYDTIRSLSEPEKESLGKIMLFRHYVVYALWILEEKVDEPEAKRCLLLEKFLMGYNLANS